MASTEKVIESKIESKTVVPADRKQSAPLATALRLARGYRSELIPDAESVPSDEARRMAVQNAPKKTSPQE